MALLHVFAKGEVELKAREKALLIGDPGVGKTTLARRLARLEDLNPDMTRGVEFYVVRGYLIWDLSGQEKFFRPLEELALRGDYLALIVVDSSRPSTLQNVKKRWAPKVESAAKALVVNKIDLAPPPPEAEEVAREIGACYFTCSAKTGEGVEPILDWLTSGGRCH